MKQINMLINAADRQGHIRPEICGHFSEHLGRCIYNGIYVGEGSSVPNISGIRRDIIDAFRQIRMPVLRWPGGCFADEYHWRDGIGKKENRPRIVNTNWGGVVEDNSFGTHEFMKLCELVGCDPYIAGNVGSGTVQELSDWVAYLTAPQGTPMGDLRAENGHPAPWHLKYLGVGNENWGCGGNMRPEYYADVYKRYQSFCKEHAGNHLYRIACGPSGGDLNWMETMMREVNPVQMQGISLHFYSIPDWDNKGLATEFDDAGYYRLLGVANHIETLLRQHSAIMDRYDPDRKIGLIVDEWGTWYDVEPDTHPGFLYQQNTMRDAMVAALSLNAFNRHSARVTMANIAQAVNVLQAVILTEGGQLIKTPTFHVFDLFKEHQSGDAVYCYTENEMLGAEKNVPMLSSSASVKDGVLTLTLANCSLTDEAEIVCDICSFAGKDASAQILAQEAHAHNTFDAPETVTIQPHTVSLTNGTLRITLPACSVAAITVR